MRHDRAAGRETWRFAAAMALCVVGAAPPAARRVPAVEPGTADVRRRLLSGAPVRPCEFPISCDQVGQYSFCGKPAAWMNPWYCADHNRLAHAPMPASYFAMRRAA